eukprot:TRINITY_DN1730_c1_g1_i1.p1 TRINITY_DN1730_c1_g1~~TRINITY_DN1730_c1_g1_i1.p1  ORF type:complete len:1159 (+),score=189.09 TRINITY_DN1730_c1_g1_i1:97-3573(+)
MVGLRRLTICSSLVFVGASISAGRPAELNCDTAGCPQQQDDELASQRVSLLQSTVRSHHQHGDVDPAAENASKPADAKDSSESSESSEEVVESGEKLCGAAEAWPKPPAKPLDYNGMKWPSTCVEKKKEYHFFLFGDYGGITCGSVNGSGDPNSWACGRQDHLFAKTADNTKDHSDRGRWLHRGIDDKAQKLVAEHMAELAKKVRPDFVLSGGDNFYFGGLDGWGLSCCHPMDDIHPRTMAQFHHVFETMYVGEGLNIPFYSVFGNHDFGGRLFTAAWDQQIAYTWAAGPSATQRWIMPGLYYSTVIQYPADNFTVEAFMLDTNKGDAKPWTHDASHNICGTFNGHSSSCEKCGGMPNRYACQEWFNQLWNDQHAWLAAALENSTADWQIIVTHFPPDQFNGRYWSNMYVKYGIDLFVGSHRHSQELHLHDRRFKGLSYVVCGGGGGITSEWNPDAGWRGRAQYGFMDVTITKEKMKVASINFNGDVIDSGEITPRPPQGELSCSHYGCGNKESWQGCMCDANCWQKGNCCADFAKTCTELTRCEVWGCNSRHDRRKPCQCHGDCDRQGNCCADYAEKCNPTCKNYGCGSKQERWKACQCDGACWQRGDCCSDVSTVCPELARCEVWGCNTNYDRRKPCQCTDHCERDGDCCEDYKEKCNPTCKNYGCNTTQQAWQACQCDKDCWKRGDCCSDYGKECPDLARCDNFGCNTQYDRKKPCQCTLSCEKDGNCCEDYKSSCNPTCKNYGCNTTQQAWQACQCDSECWKRGDCCSDYAKECPALARCELWGCNTDFDEKKPCQCTENCERDGNCCEDYTTKCEPTCKNYGCNSTQESWKACQCDSDCWKRGDCCKDYAKQCPGLARCDLFGCNAEYDRQKPCQCREGCERDGNCCEDYTTKCEPSCKNYGCNSTQESWKACQCDDECWKRGDCCKDFSKRCPALARCDLFGCNAEFDRQKPCQCREGCERDGSCCEDYKDTCKPSCENYKCGEGQAWQACSCSNDCWEKGNCCADFSTKCTALAACKEYGCFQGEDRRRPCQCTEDCEQKGNCCADFVDVCNITEAREYCESGCTVQGKTYPCRTRIFFAWKHDHRSKANAIAMVNKECEGQCKCSDSMISSSSLLEYDEERELLRAKKAALLEELETVEQSMVAEDKHTH